MTDKEFSDSLSSAILERVKEMYPEESGMDKLAHQIAKIASVVTVVAFQEYEKLNQQRYQHCSPEK